MHAWREHWAFDDGLCLAIQFVCTGIYYYYYNLCICIQICIPNKTVIRVCEVQHANFSSTQIYYYYYCIMHMQRFINPMCYLYQYFARQWDIFQDIQLAFGLSSCKQCLSIFRIDAVCHIYKNHYGLTKLLLYIVGYGLRWIIVWHWLEQISI